MAVIGSIRRRSGLLIIIIGVAMLAFLLGDIVGSGGMMGGGQGPASVGNIAGMEVDQIELEKKAEYWSALSKNYYGPITEEQARRRAWDTMVYEKVMAKEIENSGLSFTTAEFDEIRFGDNVSPDILNGQIYKDENGQFSPQRVEEIWENWSLSVKDLWNAERNRMRKDRLSKKYNTLISNGMISNSLDAADSYTAKNVTMDIQYAMKPFSSIVDSTVTITDADLKTFFSAHKDEEKYKQRAERDIELISFPVQATTGDIEAIRQDALGLVDEFSESLNDSTFSMVFSDARQYNVASYTRSEMDSLHANQVFAAADGSVVGPFRVGQLFKLYKVVGDDTKEEASVQHILLNAKEEDETISSRADSVLRALKRGADFAELAAKYSEDPGYAQNKGLYENFGKGQMVPEFETFAFEESVGSMGVVKTSFGYHIIEVLDRLNAPQKKVVELVKNIRPSSETLDLVYDEASNFSIDNSSLDKFRTGAEAKGYTINPGKSIAPSAKSVAGIPDSRGLTRWAYNTDRTVGDVSQPMEFGDQFVVAVLTGSREEGVPSFEEAKEKMRAEVIKAKKAEMMSAELGSFSGLAAAAEAWGVTSTSGNSVSLNNPQLGGVEPAVVSKAYTAESGTVVGPIIGNRGVYVLQVDSKSEVDLASVNLDDEVTTLQRLMRNSVGSKLNNAINKAKGVKNDIDRIY